MREIAPTGRILVELVTGSGIVEIRPEWQTRFNPDGIAYQTPDELILIPWANVARMRQPVSKAGHAAADADIQAVGKRAPARRSVA